MKGKKGDASIVFFVMMTIGISIASLLIIFLSERNLTSEFKNPKVVLNVYAEREIIESYIYGIIRQEVVEYYNELAGSGGFISELPICEEFNGIRVFCNIDTNLKGNFENNVKAGFFEKFKLEDLKKKYKEENINIELGLDKTKVKFDKNFKLSIENVTLLYTKAGNIGNKIIVRHNFDVAKEVNFDNIGLTSFEEIYNRLNECRSQDFKKCFKFENFDVDIEDESHNGQEFYRIKMTSKTNFFLNNELKPIEIVFLTRK